VGNQGFAHDLVGLFWSSHAPLGCLGRGGASARLVPPFHGDLYHPLRDGFRDARVRATTALGLRRPRQRKPSLLLR
jgi:hypothetical protein